MKAMVIRRLGGPEVFELTELPDPVPGHSEVVIQVYGTSVNPIDLKLRSGTVPMVGPFPAVLHGDVSGRVTAIGPEVKKFKVGDEVMGYAGGIKGRPGALAALMCTSEDFLVHKPRSIDWLQAAALPCAGITAMLALERLGLGRGQTLLIQGVSGGVGHLALQIARRWGYITAGTVTSLQKAGRLVPFGLHEVYVEESTHENWETWVDRVTHGQGFNGILNTPGGESLHRSLQAAGIGAGVSMTAARTTLDISLAHRKALSLYGFFVAEPLISGHGLGAWQNALAGIADMAGAGLLEPLIAHRVFSFEETAQAHKYLEEDHPGGKVVISLT